MAGTVRPYPAAPRPYSRGSSGDCLPLADDATRPAATGVEPAKHIGAVTWEVVSPLTARTHVSRVMAKLGARDRVQLVVLACESGLVRPGWTAG